MVSTAWSGAHDADLVCVLLDARQGIDEEADAILSKLETVNHPKFLVINKIDLVPREKLLVLAQKANERLKFAETFMISAMSGDGVNDLRAALAKAVPEGPFHYPEDQMSDAPMRHLAAEITREKIYRHLHQELDRAQGQFRSHRADDLRRARQPAQNRARQGRRNDQVHRRGFAQRDCRDRGAPGPSVFVRESA
jgi:GTPase Era involved in 16S rRNA processing